jgi:hypothetical protein
MLEHDCLPLHWIGQLSRLVDDQLKAHAPLLAKVEVLVATLFSRLKITYEHVIHKI